MKNLSLFAVLFLIQVPFFAQISTGKQPEPKKLRKESGEKKVKEKKPMEKYVPNGGVGDFSVFLGVSANFSTHKLQQNSTIFGKPVGIRADEKVLSTFSYGIGVRNRLTKNFSLELGISFDSYQVSYKGFIPESNVDGSYYRKINTLSMPILGYYVHGNKRIQVLAGAGIAPFIPLKKSVETTLNYPNSPFFQRQESLAGLTNFGFGVIVSGGIQYRFWRYGSFYLMPAYTMNLTNFYGKQEPHKEWYNSFNLRFGTLIDFPARNKQ
jgi:hypothetical protein